MNEVILNVLKQLDPKNDAQWTNEGTPRIDAVRWLAKDQSITREDVSKAAPGFSRSNPELPSVEPVEQTAVIQELPPEAVPGVARTADSTESPQEPDFANTATQQNTAPVILEGLEEGEELREARAKLTALDTEINRVTNALEEGRKYLRAKHEERDQLVYRIEELTPRRKNQNAITAYLNKQKELTQDRAKADQVLKEKLGELGKLAAPLPVDRERR